MDLENKKCLQVVEEIYDDVKDVVLKKQSVFSLDTIAEFIVHIMAYVETQRNLNGNEKQKIVILILRKLAIDLIEDESIESVVVWTIDNLVPSIINMTKKVVRKEIR